MVGDVVDVRILLELREVGERHADLEFRQALLGQFLVLDELFARQDVVREQVSARNLDVERLLQAEDDVQVVDALGAEVRADTGRRNDLVLVDAQERENEGDLCVAAEKITPEEASRKSRMPGASAASICSRESQRSGAPDVRQQTPRSFISPPPMPPRLPARPLPQKTFAAASSGMATYDTCLSCTEPPASMCLDCAVRVA
jgi:hypothetical protein